MDADIVPQLPLGDYAPREDEPIPRRTFTFRPTPLRDTDADEPEELHLETPLPILLARLREMQITAEFEARRLERVREVAARARGNAENLSQFLSERIRAYVQEHAARGKRYAELTLEEAGLPDVKVRVGLRARPPAVIVEDEQRAVDFYSANALPTDDHCGPCERIPTHWRLHKSELNELIKAGADAPPGVRVELLADAVYCKDADAPKEKL